MNFFRRAPKEKPKRPALIAFGKSVESQSYLIATTEQNTQAENQRAFTSIRGILESAKLIEANVNLNSMVKVSVLPPSGVTVPDDYADFEDYLDAYRYVPKVRRAVDLKQSMIWQRDPDFDGSDDAAKKRAKELLKKVDRKKSLRSGTLYAQLFGNMYWVKGGTKKEPTLTPLDPRCVGVRLNSDKTEIEKYVVIAGNAKGKEYNPDEVLHLKFNADPWAIFGTSSLQSILPTLKAILYIEKKLPWLARRLARPLLSFQLGDGKENTISEEEFIRQKELIEKRPEDSDIYNDGSILSIDEVYKQAGNNRQMVEPVLEHFDRNLVAGLGVSDVALGFGGTTTMATAEYQERTLEPEIRLYQQTFADFVQDSIFPLGDVSSVTLIWKPLKEEDKNALSARLCHEVEIGIISTKTAGTKLGYTPEEMEGATPNISMQQIRKEPDEEAELRKTALKAIVARQAKQNDNKDTETGNETH